MFKLKHTSLERTAFFQALGVTFYCSLIGLLFWRGSQFVPKPDPYFGPVMFLLLFIFSALTCALMVFYQPYKLFFAGKRQEAAHLVLHTTGWLFFFFLIFFLLVFLVL
jgi:hypothetical protein